MYYVSNLFFCLFYITFSPLLVSAAEDRLPTTPLTIESQNKTHTFEVEVAKDRATQQKGLMFRQHMDRNAGMLFLMHDRPRRISMWMKNTYISLDMLFINKSGTIVDIAKRTTPLSESIIKSLQPSVAVLEINGGLSEELGIAVGDRLRHPVYFP